MNSMVAPSLGEIVVVDDTPANLRLLSNLLGAQGYQVRPFPSGKLALAGIERRGADLILLDIQMPQMDGYEVCEVLQTRATTRHIPIIFISALNETLDKVQAFSMGAVDYITKPFQAEEVLARVATHVELHHLQQQLRSQNTQQASQLVSQNKALQQMNQELQQQCQMVEAAQLQVVRTEKLASLGELVAGIAHEINNPLGFIGSNLILAQEEIDELLTLVDIYQGLELPLDADTQGKIANLDIEFIREDLPNILKAMGRGVDTIQKISRSLRIFSRSDRDDEKVDFDLKAGLDSTLMILRYRLKANEVRPAIQVLKEYAEIPPIRCYPGRLNQVFMNVIANAIDAFDEKNAGLSYHEIQDNPNHLTIRLALEADNMAVVEIQDDGPGMTEAVRDRIFEQGFTTKAVGQGTGLGMAIARQIIETDHGGSLQVESTAGQGATFRLLIPYDPPSTA